MRKLLCWLGFHAWLYDEEGMYRACLFCPKAQKVIIHDTGDLISDNPTWEYVK